MSLMLELCDKCTCISDLFDHGQNPQIDHAELRLCSAGKRDVLGIVSPNSIYYTGVADFVSLL